MGQVNQIKFQNLLLMEIHILKSTVTISGQSYDCKLRLWCHNVGNFAVTTTPRVINYDRRAF